MGFIKTKIANGEIKMNTTINIKCRIAFPNVFRPSKVGDTPNAPEKYSAALLIPKADTETTAAIVKAMKLAAEEKWAAKWEKEYAFIKDDGKLCLQNGDKKADKYDGFADHWSINASSKNRPTVVNRDRSPLTEADGVIYAGCYVIARVNFWAQDNKYGKRVNSELKGIQFMKDGDSFGAGSAASVDDFEDLGDGAQADSGFGSKAGEDPLG